MRRIVEVWGFKTWHCNWNSGSNGSGEEEDGSQANWLHVNGLSIVA